MIPFDEHIFQMGWFKHQLNNTNPFFRSITPLKIHMEPKESPTWKWKSSSKPPFLVVQNANFPRCITLASKIEDLNISSGCLWSSPKHSPRTVALAWLVAFRSIFLHDKFPWFSASCWGFFGFFPEVEKIMSDLRFSKSLKQKIHIYFFFRLLRISTTCWNGRLLLPGGGAVEMELAARL